MDDVKRLLEQFADRTVDGLPPADLEADIAADVARGRRTLRRIKARRRVTGVLCIAAASTAVLVTGNQAQWWGGGETEVATDRTTGTPAGAATSSATPMTAEASPSAPAEADSTMSLYREPGAVRLAANGQPWDSIDCKVAPQGWAAQPTADRVVLRPPSARTSDVAEQLELFPADQAQRLSAPRTADTGGRIFQIGGSGGRQVGQLKLGERWLVARLPVRHQDWTDELVRRFLASCTVS